jgi:hypothetical protein
MCSSFKQELLQAAHCFNADVTLASASGTSGAFAVTVTSTAGLAVGMVYASGGAGFAAGSVVSEITSATTFVVSKALTATASGSPVFTADVIKMALVKTGNGGTYGAATTNYSQLTSGSDEVTGTGYSAGGTTLAKSTPQLTTTTAWLTFSPDPNWTSATFSANAALIYNTSSRLGAASGISGRAVSVHDFGGTQNVSNGTFTVVMPTANSTTAILRIT